MEIKETCFLDTLLLSAVSKKKYCNLCNNEFAMENLDKWNGYWLKTVITKGFIRTFCLNDEKQHVVISSNIKKSECIMTLFYAPTKALLLNYNAIILIAYLNSL